MAGKAAASRALISCDAGAMASAGKRRTCSPSARSREPLRAEGEQVRRLPALAIAPASQEMSARDAAAFPAIELFVERAAANLDSFQLNDADAPIVAQICRKLDGIPLAIELVAGRVES